MKRSSAIIAAILVLALIAGCGGNEQIQETQVLGADGFGGMQQAFDDPPDLMGRIKAIDGQTVVLNKSEMEPGQFGGRRNGANGANGPSQSGGEQRNRTPADGGDDARPERNMNDMFTDETVDVHIASDTQITARTFENNQMTELPLELSELIESDIVQVWLKPDSQEAERIVLQSGFGMPNGFRPQNRNE